MTLGTLMDRAEHVNGVLHGHTVTAYAVVGPDFSPGTDFPLQLDRVYKMTLAANDHERQVWSVQQLEDVTGMEPYPNVFADWIQTAGPGNVIDSLWRHQMPLGCEVGSPVRKELDDGMVNGEVFISSDKSVTVVYENCDVEEFSLNDVEQKQSFAGMANAFFDTHEKSLMQAAETKD